MIDIEKCLIIELEIELAINRQLMDEHHITYDIYEKVNSMILKDLDRQRQKIDKFQLVPV